MIMLATQLATGCATMQTTDSVKLVTEEFMIPAVDPGIQLYARGNPTIPDHH